MPFWQAPWRAARNIIPPALTLALRVSCIFARFLRGWQTAELNADSVRTARSKGLTARVIMLRDVTRNALLPFTTIVGNPLAGFIGGAVVTEAVFTSPGLGRLVIQAMSMRDYPLVQGAIRVILVIWALINLTVDSRSVFVDPRIEIIDAR